MLVSAKARRVVWRVETGRGWFKLKATAASAARVLFISAAHEHLHRAGGPVPALLRTRYGSRAADTGKARYLAAVWARGYHPDYGTAGGVEAVFRALAALHACSPAFDPPPGSRPQGRLGQWHHDYAEELQRLTAYRTAAARGGHSLDRAYLGLWARCYDRARLALEWLTDAPYHELCDRWRATGGLDHGDVTYRNLVMTPAGPAVHDLDALTTELPLSGIRRLLNHVLTWHGRWDAALVRAGLAAYAARRPLSAAERRVLAAELAFPHLFTALGRRLFGPDRGLVTRRYAHSLRQLGVEASRPPPGHTLR